MLKKTASALSKTPPGDIQHLQEELQIHQLELEMQNDELRKNVAELENTRKRYADLYDFAPVGYFTLDTNNQIVLLNLTATRMLGLERRRLIGRYFSKLIDPEYHRLFYNHIRQCVDTRTKQSIELRLIENHLPLRFVQLDSVAVFDNSDNLAHINMVMINITDRENAKARVTDLSRALLVAQEKERRMIACELHDRIAQQLAAIKVSGDRLMAKHANVPESLKTQLLELSALLTGSIAAVRDLSYELRPPDLERQDLPRGLFNYCHEFSQKTGIHTEFFSAGMKTVVLDEMMTINIYRLVQEGLNNVLKHAAASRAIVTCSVIDRDIVLRITDNGRGFDLENRLTEATAEKRMGLSSMEERARLLGGTMTVQSAPGRGARIHIRFPCRRNVYE